MVVTAQQPRATWTSDEIDRFRRESMSVDALLDALAGRGARLLAQPTGLGKTTLVDNLIERHLAAGTPYELIIYATSQHKVLRERPWLRTPGVAVIRGRPRKRCGVLDDAWHKLEAAGCGALGRATVCSQCPKAARCGWRSQMSEDTLGGVLVVATVQSFMSALPMFVAQVKALVGATDVLLVIDEAFIVNAEQRAVIDRATIERSAAVFRRVAWSQPELQSVLRRWHDAHALLLDNEQPLENLPSLPWLVREVPATLQREGIEMFGDSFRYLGSELQLLSRSRSWRDGDRVQYVRRPRLAGVNYIVAAAHLPLALARHRLDDASLEEFRPIVPVVHEGTQLYNLRASHGMRRHFRKNASQIVFLVAQLVAQQAMNGKRSITVAKKVFAAMIAPVLERDLRELTELPFRVLINPNPGVTTDPLVVPLITYGVEGVNTYAGFDAAFAITGFYARADALERRVNDTHAPGETVPIMLGSDGGRLHARRHWDRRAGYDELIAAYQEQYEDNVVLQALGRVRFVTQPRLVLSFQVNPLTYPLAGDFRRLDDLRRYFGLKTRRAWEAEKATRLIRQLAAEGLNASQITERTGFGRSTVYRALRPTKPILDLLRVRGTGGVGEGPDDP